MAGVFENGSVAIVTKEATGALATIHNRMPLFLPEDDWEMWLDSDVHDVALLRGVINQGLSPEGAELIADPVSTRVNKIANNGIELIEPIQLGEQQTLL
jgi:putative SOS response-associated peptidase YedK